MGITYLGHSCFELEIGNSKILIDPFLVMSPDYDFNGVYTDYTTKKYWI